jgi:hypothetical protein
VRPGLDLYLGHHGVTDDTGDQAAEPVPRRVGHHRPALSLVGRVGQLLRKRGERHPVHGVPPGGIGDHLDPSAIGPAAQGVIADPEQAGSFLDPEGRHPATLAQMRRISPRKSPSRQLTAAVHETEHFS